MALEGTADRVRRSACAAVLASGAVLLAACGGTGGSADDEAAGPGAVSPAAATEEAPEPTPAPAGDPGGTTASGDLAGRLLPAEAFGADAEVVRLDEGQPGHDGWYGGWGRGGWHDHGGDDHGGDDHGGWLEEVTVTPSTCGDFLEALPMPSEDAAAPTVAAQAAHTDAVHSWQVVAEAPELEGLALPVEELVAACSSVTVDGPGGWGATVQLAQAQVPAVGEDSGALQVTVAGWGREMTALVGIAVDGPRGMLLAQTAEPGAPAPDAAAFATLFEQAGAVAFG
ncbi:hypothetical protein SAMN05660657_01594 [Geodermatophilus amargosae]|uniref:DUF5642 domain-containing protein n=1 Tax=Geodermatophilus amargosae TaxID=1296565 RepID=A0A1I6Z1R8_9ACTN|nr:hypothetical protein [Geodermatophilus amargosae]SFT56643.1 hypothetical protein SAMN05660657_01594 [Geodermatophilus amargosae]